MQIKLHILQQFLLSNASEDPSQLSQDLRATLDQLHARLEKAYIQNLSRQSKAEKLSSEDMALVCSIKRSLKIVLNIKSPNSISGDPLNFKTLKDMHILRLIETLFSDEDRLSEVTLDQVLL